MTLARLPMIEQSPALSRPYKSARRFCVKGHKTMLAGTFEITWLSSILQMYSWPPTEALKNFETAGVLQIEEEKTKKQKNVSRRT